LPANMTATEPADFHQPQYTWVVFCKRTFWRPAVSYLPFLSYHHNAPVLPSTGHWNLYPWLPI